MNEITNTETGTQQHEETRANLNHKTKDTYTLKNWEKLPKSKCINFLILEITAAALFG